MEATERLYLTADRKRLVGEGDPKAAFLYAAPGDEIPAETAERFGLEAGGLGRKSRKGVEDKAGKPDGDKRAPAEEPGDAGAGAKAPKPGLTVNKRERGA